MKKNNLNFDYRFGFSMPEVSVYKAQKGINENVVTAISKIKSEPSWMTDFRLKSFSVFKEKQMPKWGPDLSDIDFQNIFYYLRPTEKQATSWEDLPKEIKETYASIS